MTDPRDTAIREGVEALAGAEQWLEGWASAEPYLSQVRAALSLLRAALEAREEPAERALSIRNAHAIADFVNRSDSDCGPIEALHQAIDMLAASPVAAPVEARPVVEVVILSGKVASSRERDGHGLPDGRHALYASPAAPTQGDAPQAGLPGKQVNPAAGVRAVDSEVVPPSDADAIPQGGRGEKA